MRNTHTTQDLERIGEIVLEKAYEIFVDCGEKDDFCVQYVGSTAAAFGGFNRMIWSLDRGFRLDESYCRPDFIMHFNRLFDK